MTATCSYGGQLIRGSYPVVFEAARCGTTKQKKTKMRFGIKIHCVSSSHEDWTTLDASPVAGDPHTYSRTRTEKATYCYMWQAFKATSCYTLMTLLQRRNAQVCTFKDMHTHAHTHTRTHTQTIPKVSERPSRKKDEGWCVGVGIYVIEKRPNTDQIGSQRGRAMGDVSTNHYKPLQKQITTLTKLSQKAF